MIVRLDGVDGVGVEGEDLGRHRRGAHRRDQPREALARHVHFGLQSPPDRREAIRQFVADLPVQRLGAGWIWRKRQARIGAAPG
jgi:hypothetical protein